MSVCAYSTNMAASCVTAVRTAFKGVYLVPGQTPAVCRSFLLHVSPAASLCSSRTEPQGSTQTQSSAGTHTEEQEPDSPEYIPKGKAKNPMKNIGYAWMIGLPTGIIGFLLAKRQVDKNRLKQLKVRQRMRRSNEGEYERSRYLHSTEPVKMDR